MPECNFIICCLIHIRLIVVTHIRIFVPRPLLIARDTGKTKRKLIHFMPVIRDIAKSVFLFGNLGAE